MKRRKVKRVGAQAPAPALSKRQLWCFRALAVFGVPLLFMALLEFGLRISGFGYPTDFLLESSDGIRPTLVQNNQFSWRFFGPRAARQPHAMSIPREKPTDTIRIVVFGESAAFGDPQPRFGLPRMLEAILGLRHPDRRFEVINAAMTGINSHVIRPLARDCARMEADVWVVYMGNNEVVGPFGAGTVFGKQTPPLSVIRGGLAFKAARMGQMVDMMRQATVANGAGSKTWEGMRAFVDNKVAYSDPRLEKVYTHFRANLDDILEFGQRSGARVVLSTVAVNLRDCAPFSSLHSPGLDETSLREWQRHFDAGVSAQIAGDLSNAVAQFRKATAIDDRFAELRYRLARCLDALGDAAAARREFMAARDLDALRFRCDTRLNDIIREQATGGVLLADAEEAFASASREGVPGIEYFYEHVHLTFSGNYLLARVLAEKVEQAVGMGRHDGWPQIAECADRLGYTQRGAQLALSDIRGRMSDVPFTFQSDHQEHMQKLAAASLELPPPNAPGALSDTGSALERALKRWPADAVLWEQLAEVRQVQRNLQGALEAASRARELVPSSTSAWLLSGILLAEEQRYEEAMAAFSNVFDLDPQAVWARHNYALCLEKLGRREEAVGEFKRALRLKPEYGTSWLALGQLYETLGQTNDAQMCFATALTNRVNQADDLATMARFCESRRWFDLATTNFLAAIELCPSDAGLRLEAGRVLMATGRAVEAVQQYAAAVELEPGAVQPHMQLGVTLGRLRKPDLAEKEFRSVVQLDPTFTEGRVNLGIALYQQQKFSEAIREFEEVLRRDPNDPNAERYLQDLRNRAPAMSSP